MRLTPTTSLNDCIKRIAEGNTGAATVLALIVKERPSEAMRWMRRMDDLEFYGQQIWDAFRLCRQEIGLFLESVENGSVKGPR